MWLKENPDKAMAGTAGIGSTSHVSAVNFQGLTGTQFRFVPYRGLGPAMLDLVGGHIDILFDLAANSVPQVRQGTIKALAVTFGQPPHFVRRSSYRRRSWPARILLPQLACDLGATRCSAT